MSRINFPRRFRPGKKRSGRVRPVLELLEDRPVLSNYTAASVTDLIADISAANTAGGTNTITLASCNPFMLASPYLNTSDGLPAIATGNNLSIQGNGATLARSSAPKTLPFRFFDVSTNASLTLENLTISNGLVIGAPGQTACGGAILNEVGGR